MNNLVRCLACGQAYDLALEMCPRRYLLPHSVEFMTQVAELMETGLTHDEAIQQSTVVTASEKNLVSDLDAGQGPL